MPVVSVPAGAASEALRLLRAGEPAMIEIGAPRERENPLAGGAAAFSSDGLAFDGSTKPEVLAPGVALLTSLPGRGADGEPAFGTVSGSSAAAAVAASGAALLAQARPDLDARGLRGALVGSAADGGRRAQARSRCRSRRRGDRRAGLGAARPCERPRLAGHGPVHRAKRLRASARRQVSTGELGEVGGVALAVSPARFRLAPREKRKVSVVARLAYVPPGVQLIAANFELEAGGAAPVRVPWTLTLGRYERDLLGAVRLSTNRFKPSDSAPALLELRAGRVAEGPGEARCSRCPTSTSSSGAAGSGWAGSPGFGTCCPAATRSASPGRGPAGRRLAPGRYTLRLLGYPPGDAPPSRQFVQFTIR